MCAGRLSAHADYPSRPMEISREQFADAPELLLMLPFPQHRQTGRALNRRDRDDHEQRPQAELKPAAFRRVGFGRLGLHGRIITTAGRRGKGFSTTPKAGGAGCWPTCGRSSRSGGAGRNGCSMCLGRDDPRPLLHTLLRGCTGAGIWAIWPNRMKSYISAMPSEGL